MERCPPERDSRRCSTRYSQQFVELAANKVQNGQNSLWPESEARGAKVQKRMFVRPYTERERMRRAHETELPKN